MTTPVPPPRLVAARDQVPTDIARAGGRTLGLALSTLLGRRVDEMFDAAARERHEIDPTTLELEVARQPGGEYSVGLQATAHPLDPVFYNPDCVAGSHRACAGDAWNFDTDEPTSCDCPCHREETPA